MTFKAKYQPIPVLHDLQYGDAAWCWAVSQGMMVVARFGNEEDAKAYAAWKNRQQAGLIIDDPDYGRVL